MTEIARELARLLDEERQAAVAADLDALEGLQQCKERLLERLRAEGGPSSPGIDRLAEIARGNLALIRQLVALHRAFVGLEATPSYGSDGREAEVAAPPATRRFA